jgi:hypothetical protein
MEETKTLDEVYSKAMQEWPQDMVHPIAIATADGLLYGVRTFFQHNEIDVSPGTGSEHAGKDFVIGLMSEFKPEGVKEDKEIPYPLSNSFRGLWASVLNELSPVLIALWGNGEKDHAIQLTRTVAFGEALKFFESSRKEVIDWVSKTRGDDLPASEEKPK